MIKYLCMFLSCSVVCVKCLQCLGSVGGIQSECHPAVGIQIGGVPLFLILMDREGILSLQLLLFSSVVRLEGHAHSLVLR